MRIGLVMGTGVAGLFISATGAFAQYGPAGAAPRGPQLPPGLQPVGPVAHQPATQPIVRANYPVAQAAESPPHPWSVKPENGAWMILVRGYVGPDARRHAERLCKEIRDTHKVAAYVYERNAVERKKERELQEAIRKKAEEDAQPFILSMEQAKRKAQQEGSVFIPTAPRLKVPKPLNELPEQWAVLIGGFPDGDAARRALNTVKKFPHPKDPELLQEAFITQQTEKGPQMEQVYLNPFASAMALPNPTIPQSAQEDRTRLEPFIIQLNKDVPHSLLNVKKPWTLMVKTFSTPMKLTGKDGGGNVFDRGNGLFGKKNMLDLTAAQAMQLCDALRHKDMKPMPMESFVLHHRTGSIVTVGQYNSIDDPELLKMQQTLKGMSFKVMDEKTRMEKIERMFDSVSPFPVPKQ